MLRSLDRFSIDNYTRVPREREQSPVTRFLPWTIPSEKSRSRDNANSIAVRPFQRREIPPPRSVTVGDGFRERFLDDPLEISPKIPPNAFRTLVFDRFEDRPIGPALVLFVLFDSRGRRPSRRYDQEGIEVYDIPE